MKNLKWVLLLGVAATAAVVAFAVAKTPKDIKTSEIRVKDSHGSVLYAQHCASCHGANLQGGMAANLKDGKWEFARNKTEIIALIKDGNDDLGMPGFGAQLSGDDIDTLHAFMQSKANAGAETITPATEAAQVGSNLIQTEVWLGKLESPWGLVFTGSNHALMTEKVTGNLREIVNGKLVAAPVTGTPKVNPKRQGGMLDVAVDLDYATNKWVYLSFSHQLENAPDLNMTKIVRGHITGGKWTDEQVLFVAKPEDYQKTQHHYGSRITFDDKGHMFFSVGDRGKKEMAQDITQPNGKIHRLMRDGSVPKDNPFLSNADAYPSIYSYGARNPQGLVFTNGQLWETEHGPRGGDELNLIQSGKNYGWPSISYGRNYNGTVMTEYTHMDGMIQPISQWTPSIAACGLDVVSGDMFKKWDGFLVAGSLKFEEVRLIKLKNGAYVSEQILLKDRGRVRDVTVGPDGAIYAILNTPDQILRLTPGDSYGSQ